MRNLIVSIVSKVWFAVQVMHYEYLKRKNYREIERDMKKCGWPK